MAALDIEEVSQGLKFKAKVVPGSSKTAFAGILNGMLKVKVAAPPEKGKANKCLSEFIAKQLGIKKNAVIIVSGLMSAVKQIQINGVSISDLRKLTDG